MTDTEVFYFSGTGNALYIARGIARRAKGTLVPIKSLQSVPSVESGAQRVGLVFPAYYMRIPRIVERFVERLTVAESTYVFAVVTVAGIAGEVLDRLSAVLGSRDVALASGFIVRMPPNYIDAGDALPPFLQRRWFRKCDRKLDVIGSRIAAGERGRMETVNPLGTMLFSRTVERQYQSGGLRPDADTHFWVDENCSHCGTCHKVCPVSNIRMDRGSPTWGGACEKCLACIQWCPEQAIQFGDVTQTRRRYHHPEVALSDMIDAGVEKWG